MTCLRRLPLNLHLTLGLFLGIGVTTVFRSYVSLLPRERSQSAVRREVTVPGLPDQLEFEHDRHGDPGEVVRPVAFKDAEMHDDDDTVTQELFSSQRVLCWIMTGPQNLDTKAIHLRNTWGKRCNKLLFMSSQWNSSFPTIGLNVSEGRQHLTAKTMEAFRYVYHNHFDDADWFMKADDDTYVIMENLRYFLSSINTNDPVYVGHVFKAIVKQGYPSGGAGYVLSKEALRRAILYGNNASLCRQDGGAEDAEFGKCMEKLGVKMASSLDRLGRSRFHCLDPASHIHGRYDLWYYSYDANGAKKGIGNISDYAISFHYIRPNMMYVLEYLIYHLRPFGIGSQPQMLNAN